MVVVLWDSVNVNEIYWYLLHAHEIVNRVHWLRARAQMHRWNEELILVGHEMKWTVQYYMHQSRIWNDRIIVAREMGENGAAAYASRKKAIWGQMAAAAKKQFQQVNPLFVL
jgi:hypothetical protein